MIITSQNGNELSVKEMLDFATQLMEKGKEVYHPSKYWKTIAKKNNKQLLQDGFENIKIRQGLDYFNFLVFEWSYWQFQYVWKRSSWKSKIRAAVTALTSSPYPNFPMEERQRWMYVYYHCLLWDYVKRFDTKQLLELEEQRYGNPLLVTWRNKTFSQDLLNSIIEAYSILEALESLNKDPKTILEIGGGYGRNEYVLKNIYPKAKIIMVDIVPGIVIAQWYIRKVFPNKNILQIRDFQSFSQIRDAFNTSDFIFLLPHQIELLPKKSIDLFININSFQEMTLEQIKIYFSQINRLTNGVFYTKQWKEQYNEIDKIKINEYDYPIHKMWKELFHRDARVQSKFFEAAYQIS